MNLSHIRSLLGILRLISIIIGLLTASIGSASYYLSNYNRHCHDLKDSFPSAIPTTTVGIIPPGKESNPTINLPKSSYYDVQQLSTESSDYDPTKDMAPVLWMERFSIAVTWMGTIISIILLILCLLFESLDFSKLFKSFNFVFHFLWTVFLIVSAVFVGYSAYEIKKQICDVREFENGQGCQKYILKIVAAVFDTLMALSYASICCKILGTKLYYTA